MEAPEGPEDSSPGRAAQRRCPGSGPPRFGAPAGAKDWEPFRGRLCIPSVAPAGANSRIFLTGGSAAARLAPGYYLASFQGARSEALHQVPHLYPSAFEPQCQRRWFSPAE